MISDFALTEDQANKIVALKMPGGFEPFSVTALESFLPELAAGTKFGALTNGLEYELWRDETFPRRDKPTGEELPRLPSPATREEQARLTRLRNPTVARCQNELRKVVNNLIRVFGKPDHIRIELAREIGLSKKKREAMIAGRDANEKARKAAEKELRQSGVPATAKQIDKYLLWLECNKTCPYTGDSIGFDALFNNGAFDVEHIWPRSICHDNGMGNKTLARRDFNIKKGNRLPYEMFAHDPEAWAVLCRRLDRTKVNAKGKAKDAPGMSAGKIKRFLAREITGDFAARQLVDTSYAAREAMAMLKRLWPDQGQNGPVHVQAVAGRVTAHLRRYWKLNHILGDTGEKNRADHRHHAIDALVVACCDQASTMQLADYFKFREEYPNKPKPEIVLPWPTLREDAARATETIIVSHRVQRKLSGSLHNEQPASPTGETRTKANVRYNVYVRRQPVTKLKHEALMVESLDHLGERAAFGVRDQGVRRRLLAQAEQNLAAANARKKADPVEEAANDAEGEPTAKKTSKPLFPPYASVSDGGPEIRSVRTLYLNQPKLLAHVMNGYVETANNHHIAIYRKADGKPDFEVVSLREAACRHSRHVPVIRRSRHPGDRFIMSLCKGDAVRFKTGDYEGIWIVQDVASKGQLTLLPHSQVLKAKKTT
ncbi:MAG: type II CRISPR RNA-guided endonuclease Cas9, partial [Acidocella sp.]|nr:type II CRISPR RNA-guided endonuclease Cas9 [Acidocella sp.]